MPRQLAPDVTQVVARDLDDPAPDLFDELLRGAVGALPAQIEDGDPVAALGLVHQVGRDDHGRAGIDQVEQPFPEVPPRLGIDGGGRLVQEQKLGLVNDRRRQRQALALPAAQRTGKHRGLLAQVVGLQ
jgi:hypothetical protein